MNYAIIENGVCVNTILADTIFAEQIGAVLLPDGFGIGDSFIDDVWARKETPIPDPIESDAQPDINELVRELIEQQAEDRKLLEAQGVLLAQSLGMEVAQRDQDTALETLIERTKTISSEIKEPVKKEVK